MLGPVKYLRKAGRILIGKKRNGRKFLFRMIWFACLSVSLPVLIAGTLYYEYSTGNITRQINAESQASLSLAMTRMERVLQTIEKDSYQLANNPSIKNSFTSPDFENNMFTHISILDTILFEKNASEFIDEIYYYNNKSGIILSNKYGYVRINDFNYRQDIDTAMKLTKEASWQYLTIASREGYISYVRQLPIMNLSKPFGLIIIHVKVDLLQKYFNDNLKLSNIRTSYILNSDEEMLLNINALEAVKPTTIKNMVFDSIKSNQSDYGSFYDRDAGGRPVYYTFARTLFGRTYITMTPKSEIVKEIVWIRWFVLVTTLVPLSIGIILTVILSRRIYSPIEDLLNYSHSLSNLNIEDRDRNEIACIKGCLDYLNKEADALKNYIQQEGPSLREGFLQKLLHGNYDNSSNTLRKDCEKYKVSLDAVYIVLVTDIENYNMYKLSHAENPFVVNLAVKDILNELLRDNNGFGGHAVSSSNGRTAAVLYFSQGTGFETISSTVYEFGERIRDKVSERLYLAVSVGIGRAYSNITDVTVSHNEAVQALQYRIYRDTEHVLYIDDLEKHKKKSAILYPHELEKTIVSFLDSGKTEEAEKSLEEFAKIVRSSESYNFILQSYQMLLSTVVFSFEGKGGSILDLLEFNLFDQLKECHTSTEIFNWFINNLFPLYKKLVNESENVNGKAIVLKICTHVKHNIINDFSLVQCSEFVGMSPSYISRLFKKVMGMSFLDYVVKCKVEEVKRLLVETEEGIGEIASTVGYSERNLYRIFHKYVNMSPNEYRSINR